MSPVDVLGSQAGRVVRVVAGAGLMTAGLRHGGRGGTAVAALATVPLAAGLADRCVLGPLVGGPFDGAAFRRARAAG